MTTALRRLRQGIDDEAPLHYEGMELRPAVRTGARLGGALAAGIGIFGMVRGAGALFEPVGALLGAVGVVVMILSWRFRLFEIVVGERWLILRCGPVRHRFGRSDVAVGPAWRATSWRRLFAEHEVVVTNHAHGVEYRCPIVDAEELRRVTGAERTAERV
ncbi:MAG TPA: hypothetical protein ENK19_08585, partial [Acidobacteria bacterium]|nr:hypothetical protein [Acidobacteriota bacterium]